MDLKQYIRDVPDFPIPGVLFKDITPLLSNPAAFCQVIDHLTRKYEQSSLDSIVAIDARGFLFAAPVAYRLGKPLVPARKPGKLPWETRSFEYSLEYGEAAIEMHVDGVGQGDKVLLLDDLLATGGTLAAATRLVESIGGEVAGVAVVIELTELDGRKGLEGYDVYSIVQY
ncbi:Adenine phosphoribosyltransferase [Geodia barretti]|uniref:Adenine phosphoribosyltransferase n=1 Tax=Geodia barretti TaxID=519541 RepID=A0AA35SQY1_GEOBA|nr:Adenine phosphoribosyltransferase [Geodia barretti]